MHEIIQALREYFTQLGYHVHDQPNPAIRLTGGIGESWGTFYIGPSEDGWLFITFYHEDRTIVGTVRVDLAAPDAIDQLTTIIEEKANLEWYNTISPTETKFRLPVGVKWAITQKNMKAKKQD